MGSNMSNGVIKNLRINIQIISNLTGLQKIFKALNMIVSLGWK